MVTKLSGPIRVLGRKECGDVALVQMMLKHLSPYDVSSVLSKDRRSFYSGKVDGEYNVRLATAIYNHNASLLLKKPLLINTDLFNLSVNGFFTHAMIDVFQRKTGLRNFKVIPGTSVIYSSVLGFKNNTFSRFPIPVALSNRLRRLLKTIPLKLELRNISFKNDGRFYINFQFSEAQIVDSDKAGISRRSIPKEANDYFRSVFDTQHWKYVASRRSLVTSIKTKDTYSYLEGKPVLSALERQFSKGLMLPNGVARDIFVFAIRQTMKIRVLEQEGMDASQQRKNLATLIDMVSSIDVKYHQFCKHL